MGLIAVVGGGYGMAQSLSGGGEPRASAPTASESTADQATVPSEDRPSVAAAASSAPGARTATPSPSASTPETAGKGRDEEKKKQAGTGAQEGAGQDARTSAKSGDTPSTGDSGSGSGSGSGSRNSSRSNSGNGDGNGSGKGPSSVRETSSGGGGARAGGANGTYVRQIVDMVNAERAKAGCSPVAINAKLQAAAQGHSDDMAARNYYDHTSPEGKGPGDRITAAGYHWSTYGENIFKSPQDARTAMDGWMKSSGHRSNILNCSFKEIGVGVNFASNGPWWTQNFGASF
ncbi:CAP domain-containing protein [Streptomyces luteoverticillatus]|nr:CAP domain-containing protein [Streptomyces luteoverticillatus]